MQCWHFWRHKLDSTAQSCESKATFTAGWIASKAWNGIAPTKEGEQTRIDYDYKTWRSTVSEGQSCSGCLGASIHHTCGRSPDARNECQHPNSKLAASYGPEDFADGKSSVDVYECPDCGEEYDVTV